MARMKDVKAIVRTECVAGLLEALKESGVSRFYLSKVHAIGRGVDPDDYKLSLDEGSAYTEKTAVEFVCAASRAQELIEVIRTWAGTGRRGDGIVIVSDVSDVVNVRTGDHNRIALL